MNYELDKSNNSKKLIIEVFILFCIIILIIGGTFAFFTQSDNNELGNIVTTDIDGTLLYRDDYEENNLYNRQGLLIPSDLEVALKTYKRVDTENKCLDSTNIYAACSVYRFSIKNNSNVTQELIMNLNPTANSYNNLKFLLFEIKNNNPEQINNKPISLEKGNYSSIQLVENFTLTPNEERMYELVFYVENQNYAQDDAGKEFGASISINSITTGAYVTKQYGTTCWNYEEEKDENGNTVGYKLTSFNGINNNYTFDDEGNIVYDEKYGEINESCTGYVEKDNEGFYTVDIPSKFANKDITTIGNSLLMALDIENDIFNNYNKIKSINIKEGIKSIEDGCFDNSDCEEEVSPFFYNGINLETAESYFKDGLQIKVPSTLEHIGDYSLYFSAVKNIELPKNLKIIGESAFYMSSLSHNIKNPLIIPKSVVTIKKAAFSSCDKLTRIEFEDALDNSSSLETIGDGAFLNTPLEYTQKNDPLIIPSSVITIGDSSFHNDGEENDNLMFVKYMGNRTAFDKLGSSWYEKYTYARSLEEYDNN